MLLETKRKKNGFTFIELLVSVSIIMVLMTIGIVAYNNVGKSSRDAKRKSDIETVKQAMALYRSDVGSYPTGLNYAAVAQILVTNNYLPAPYPNDPLVSLDVLSPFAKVLDIQAYAAAYNPYRYNGSSTAFCICADVEDTTKGNSSTPPNATCSGIGVSAGGTDPYPYYCAKQL